MPSPMTGVNYAKISCNIRDAVKIVAEKSMEDAVEEAKLYKRGVADIGVSVVGTWQKRGYTSSNGVIVAISIDIGKIVDLQLRNPTTTTHNAIYLGVSLRETVQIIPIYINLELDSASVIKLVRPIYMALMNPKELAKCLHGKTQNQNESFNSMSWERVPKITYAGKDILDFAVYDAAANFNDGRLGSIDLFKQLNIRPGYYTTISCYMLNKRRGNSAKYKSTESTKKRRKLIRAQKKTKSHKQKKLKEKLIKLVDFSLSILFSIVIIF